MPNQETASWVFRNFMAAVFLPYGGCKWAYECHVKGVTGVKKFIFLSLGGVFSWALALISLLLFSRPYSTIGTAFAGITYIIFLFIYGFFSEKKAKEIDRLMSEKLQKIICPE